MCFTETWSYNITDASASVECYNKLFRYRQESGKKRGRSFYLHKQQVVSSKQFDSETYTLVASVKKKARTRLYYLRKFKSFDISPKILQISQSRIETD